METTRRVPVLGPTPMVERARAASGLAAAAAVMVAGVAQAQIAEPNTQSSAQGALALAATLGQPGQQLGGRQFSWSVRAGALYSDNVTRVATNEISDSTAIAGLRLAYTSLQQRFAADVAIDAEYQYYFSRDLKSQVLGGVSGRASYAILPERVTWVLEENFGQVRTDVFAVDSPLNRENVNFLSTGPDVSVPIGTRTYALASFRYSDASYEVRDIDNTRLQTSAGLQRRLSERSTFGVFASQTEVRYKDIPAAADFEQQSAYAQLSAAGMRTTLQAQVGYSRSRIDGVTLGDGGLMAGVTLVRRLTPRQSLAFEASRNRSDSADSFRRVQAFRGPETATTDSLTATDTFRADLASVGWNLEGARNALRVRGSWGRDRHDVETTFDRSRWSGDVSYLHTLSPRVNAGLEGHYSRQTFDNVDRRVSEWSAQATLAFRLLELTTLDVRVGQFHGESAPTPAYTEKRVELSLRYGRQR